MKKKKSSVNYLDLVPKRAEHLQCHTDEETGLLLGAALGMAGAYCLCHSPRQLKRTTRRLTRSAENALCELEDLIARYRD